MAKEDDEAVATPTGDVEKELCVVACCEELPKSVLATLPLGIAALPLALRLSVLEELREAEGVALGGGIALALTLIVGTTVGAKVSDALQLDEDVVVRSNVTV